MKIKKRKTSERVVFFRGRNLLMSRAVKLTPILENKIKEMEFLAQVKNESNKLIVERMFGK